MYKYMYMYVLVLVGTLLVQQGMEWPLARDYCLGIGGHLLEAKTQAEFDEAIRIKGNIYKMWLGGSDHRDEGNWVWDSDLSPVDLDRFWENGQPDGRVNSDEDYMAMDSGGEFKDRSSSAIMRFACKLN